MTEPFFWRPDGTATTPDGYTAEISVGGVSGKLFVKVSPPRGLPSVTRCSDRADGQKWAAEELANFRKGKT